MGKNCIAAIPTRKVHLSKGSQAPESITWTLQVQRTRDKWNGPTEHSAVCSEHFTEGCLEPVSAISKLVGMKMKQMLKPTALPAIFKQPSGDFILHLLSGKEKEQGPRAKNMYYFIISSMLNTESSCG